MSKRLTLELGLRLTHFQPWIDRTGAGYSIFNYSQYKTSCQPTQYCGFQWNKRDPSVPLGGFPTRSMFFQPRFGVAYDISGKGNTVLRGGWGKVLLPLRTVHQRPGCGGGGANHQPRQ